MAYGESFLEFFKEKKLGKWNFDFKTFESSYEFSFDEFHHIIDLDIVFNGQKGGLVLGNLHTQGGIHLISPNLETEVMKYSGEMEGWEYLSAPLKSIDIGKEFEKFNVLEKGGLSKDPTEFNIPPSCKVIETFNEPIALIILSVHHQFIVNRFATKKYINELIKLDLKNMQ
ncbi:MAG TPA: hypothetical protein DCL77_01700 [Prolixibacteraceae bacterium]|jgi:hypothetical protein|nr:hypothetical protein [Prolixibacteraceae bacterium]